MGGNAPWGSHGGREVPRSLRRTGRKAVPSAGTTRLGVPLPGPHPSPAWGVCWHLTASEEVPGCLRLHSGCWQRDKPLSAADWHRATSCLAEQTQSPAWHSPQRAFALEHVCVQWKRRKETPEERKESAALTGGPAGAGHLIPKSRRILRVGQGSEDRL